MNLHAMIPWDNEANLGRAYNDAMRRLRDMGILPDHVAVDITGSAGVFDIMVNQWKKKGCRMRRPLRCVGLFRLF